MTLRRQALAVRLSRRLPQLETYAMNEKHTPEEGQRTGEARDYGQMTDRECCDVGYHRRRGEERCACGYKGPVQTEVKPQPWDYVCSVCFGKADRLIAFCAEHDAREAVKLVDRSGEALPPGITPVEYVDREELLARYAKPKCETTEGHSCAYETVDHPPRRERAKPKKELSDVLDDLDEWVGEHSGLEGIKLSYHYDGRRITLTVESSGGGEK